MSNTGNPITCRKAGVRKAKLPARWMDSLTAVYAYANLLDGYFEQLGIDCGRKEIAHDDANGRSTVEERCTATRTVGHQDGVGPTTAQSEEPWRISRMFKGAHHAAACAGSCTEKSS
jgi:hypothetical protein